MGNWRGDNLSDIYLVGVDEQLRSDQGQLDHSDTGEATGEESPMPTMILLNEDVYR